jgi:hypothetical protein
MNTDMYQQYGMTYAGLWGEGDARSFAGYRRSVNRRSCNEKPKCDGFDVAKLFERFDIELLGQFLPASDIAFDFSAHFLWFRVGDVERDAR